MYRRWHKTTHPLDHSQSSVSPHQVRLPYQHTRNRKAVGLINLTTPLFGTDTILAVKKSRIENRARGVLPCVACGTSVRNLIEVENNKECCRRKQTQRFDSPLDKLHRGAVSVVPVLLHASCHVESHVRVPPGGEGHDGPIPAGFG